MSQCITELAPAELIARFASARQRDLFSAIDFQLAKFASQTFATDHNSLAAERSLIVSLCLAVSRANSEGHVCIDLLSLANTSLIPANDTQPELCWPGASVLTTFADSLMAEIDKQTGDNAGSWLRLDRQDSVYLLYFAKHFDIEQRLLRHLRQRCTQQMTIDVRRGSEMLQTLYPDINHAEEIDWQALAVATALLMQCAVITGGPGTGKTTTVMNLLTVLLDQADEEIHISIAAPTGKAATRLSDEIRNRKNDLPLSERMIARIPDEASTIHRLLGVTAQGQFRHHVGNRLHCDLLVVDEASMIDVATMVSLLDALKPQARLILLGDKDQLASVELGSVMAQLCPDASLSAFTHKHSVLLAALMSRKGEDYPWLSVDDCWANTPINSVIKLQKSYRFDEHSGIGRLAQAVNRGEPQAAQAVLLDDSIADANLIAKHRTAKERQLNQPCQALLELAIKQYQGILSAGSFDQQFERFNDFRVLAALREGVHGVNYLNQAIREGLARQGALKSAQYLCHGTPIMISQNDYDLGLFNGDIGMIFQQDSGQLLAAFPDAEGMRYVLPAKLPNWELAFVMSIHKSQGSEFSKVAIILPNLPSPMLSRELLYTGITRAKAQIQIYAASEELSMAISSKNQRRSGLGFGLYPQLQNLALG